MPWTVQYLPSDVLFSGSVSVADGLAKLLNEAEEQGADQAKVTPTPVGDYLVLAHFPPSKHAAPVGHLDPAPTKPEAKKKREGVKAGE